MARKRTFVRLAIRLLAAIVMLGVAGAAASLGAAAPPNPEAPIASPAQGEGDLGDAPDSTNTLGPPMTAYPASGIMAQYPTVFQIGSPPFGPIHRLPGAVAWLGQGFSLEQEADIGFDQDGPNNIMPPANVPDLDGFDDGLVLPLTLPHCAPATITYIVNVVNPMPLFINVWFDWQRDGEWDDTANVRAGACAGMGRAEHAGGLRRSGNLHVDVARVPALASYLDEPHPGMGADDSVRAAVAAVGAGSRGYRRFRPAIGLPGRRD